MKLVIGGAFQGKTQYAEQTYRVQTEEWLDGRTCQLSQIYTGKAIHHFHQYLRRQMDLGQDLSIFTEKLKKENPQLILVTDEVGYGIVPMDAGERAWREQCGRVCTRLAKEAEEVIRVQCGIGVKIK